MAKFVSGPQWYSLYCSAMLELDRGKAPFQIGCAQKAIDERIAELRAAPPVHAREPQDLSHASSHLRILHEQIGAQSERMLWD
jgi:hypothetical protein